jgi:hypothetical protein
MEHETREPPPRIVRLVLVTPDGTSVGQTPPFRVEVPWWQEAGPVVRAAREQLGLDITLLRLLATVPDRPHGGEVTYLAEVREPVAAEPWSGLLDDHPLRLGYAKPGGPTADLDWALSVLRRQGRAPAGDPVQVRSWNLSSIWRIPVGGQTAWLKVVPPFFGHEGAMIEALAGGPVPSLLGRDGCRVLMADVPGEDMYDAALPRLLDMVTTLVGIQASRIGRVNELLAMGLPDWRGPALSDAIADVTRRSAGELSNEETSVLDRFIDDLPDRLLEIEACGLPDTLVHGDFHAGNVRGGADSLTLLDWGDSGVGHPMLDQSAFLDRIDPAHVATVRDRWNDEWRMALPGSNPARAAALLAPVAAARQAVIYQRFLDNIEPSEQVYHRGDPVDWLRRTAALLGGSRE